jgi:hypothetical protein
VATESTVKVSRKISIRVLYRGLVLNRFFEVTYTMENGLDIGNLECQESLYVKVIENRSKKLWKV